MLAQDERRWTRLGYNSVVDFHHRMADWFHLGLDILLAIGHGHAIAKQLGQQSCFTHILVCHRRLHLGPLRLQG